MDWQEAVSVSNQLAQRIANTGFVPHQVLGIARGGILPARIVSDFFACPVAFIKVARPMNALKNHGTLSRLPGPVKRALRRLEMRSGLYRFWDRRIISEVTGKISPGPIIVVDDSLDTGKTMREVVAFLRAKFRIDEKDMLIAVITQMYSDAIPQADCAMFRNINFCFPWSCDSNQYRQFIAFCQAHSDRSGLEFVKSI